jgi:hypothetical protein
MWLPFRNECISGLSTLVDTRSTPNNSEMQKKNMKEKFVKAMLEAMMEFTLNENLFAKNGETLYVTAGSKTRLGECLPKILIP